MTSLLCIVYGLCDYLGKINEDDLESRQNTASVLAPRVSETATLSHNFSTCAWIAQGNLSARASTVEGDAHAHSARSAEGNLRLIPNKDTTEEVVERANETTNKEPV